MNTEISQEEIAELEAKVAKLKKKGLIPSGYCSALAEHKIFFATKKEAETAYEMFGKKLKCGFMTTEDGKKIETYMASSNSTKSFFNWN